MAGIDKTYTDSYKDYKEFKDWSDKQVLTFFNGHKVRIGEWVWEYEKEDFDNGEIPIMNSPTWLDIYLIQNCRIDFVLERMKYVYGNERFEKFKTIDLTSPPSGEYKQNRKIVIEKNNKFPIQKRPLLKSEWWLQCNDNFFYCDETKTWTGNGFFYPNNTNTAHIKTVKAVIRHLRKQYLPKGITFNLIGRYVDEHYTIYIK